MRSAPLLFILVLTLLSCSGNQNPIIGKWKLKQMDVSPEMKEETFDQLRSMLRNYRLDIRRNETFNLSINDSSRAGNWLYSSTDTFLILQYQNAVSDTYFVEHLCTDTLKLSQQFDDTKTVLTLVN